MKEKIVGLKGLRKDADVAAHPIKSLIKKCAEYVQTKYLKAYNAAEATIGTANKKVGDWEAAEERRTQLEKRQEQERQDKKRAEEAAAQRVADAKVAADRKKARIAELNQMRKEKKITAREHAKLLREAGAQEESDLARAEADAEEHVATTPVVQVVANKPKVAGTIARKNYSAKCLDRRIFVAQFMERVRTKKTEELIRVTREDGKVEEVVVDWWDYISVSDEALSKTAREVKSNDVMEATFLGVKAEEKRTY